MDKIATVFRKEFNGFFSSPAAWLFLGGFLLITLFIFFWAEAFFARNIADLKPLFQWMPILLIFLTAALTMRAWSEERRAGTLESLLTSPTRPWHLILGKFFAALALVALALLLTLPLAITVSLLGPLDWGPVIGGYLASLFLAAAYIAIGLTMSARTDNPIVALILSAAVAGAFYLIGSPLLTSLFGHRVGGVLELLGAGSRFDAITRGVLDLRDIVYYLSLVGLFLTLNRYSLERLRWAGNPQRPEHRRWGWAVALAAINLVLLNLWLSPLGKIRADLTQGKLYSLSDTTRNTLSGLQEPLLIRGYFSNRSHPLLEPLVPELKDLLKEYQVAGDDKPRVEFIDPTQDQAVEEEAAEKYGVKPVPFRMASRYEAGVVNSYFHIVVAYGDQYEVLPYDQLIEVKSHGEDQPEVVLKNPEYAITRAIKKVASAWQSGGNVFANLQKPITFHGYISGDDKLPKPLREARAKLQSVLDEMKQQAGDKLKIDFADPDAGDGKLAKELGRKYGLAPQIASLLDPRPFWFYMLLDDGDQVVQAPLPARLDEAELKKSLQAAIQHMAPGFLKTVALVKPPAPMANPFMPGAGGKRYQDLRDILSENVRLIDTDLKDGHVPADADLLLLLAPDKLDDKQLYAVDQFLMQGGSVVIASSPFDVSIRGGLTASKHQSGLEKWLKHHGLTIGDSLVLDPQNASLPIPVRRQIGPIAVNEIRMLPYPHFPDIRGKGLNADSPVTRALGQLTMSWASPISVDTEKNKLRKVTRLLRSSEQSWTSTSLNVVPNYQRWPDTGFEPGDQRGAQTLAVAVEGEFDSWFKGKPSPLLKKPADKKQDEDKDAKKKKDDEADKDLVVGSVIERSSSSARIVLIASNAFASDAVISLLSQGQGVLYTRPLEFLQNAIDWSLDDQGLVNIRSRARFARVLKPMTRGAQQFWEYLNYALALLGLGLVWLWRRRIQRRKQAHYNDILAEV